LKVTAPDGKVTDAHLKAGEVRFRNALTHAIEDTGDRFGGSW